MTGNLGATRSSIIPQPTTCSKATLPKRPVNRHETELVDVIRQLRKTARAVAIRAPSISYCESFAIANSLHFRDSPGLSGAADVKHASDAAARRGGGHADDCHLQAAAPPIADEHEVLVGAH